MVGAAFAKCLEILALSAQSASLIPVVTVLGFAALLPIRWLRPSLATSLSSGLALLTLAAWSSRHLSLRLSVIFDGIAILAILVLFAVTSAARDHDKWTRLGNAGALGKIFAVFLAYCVTLSCLHIIPTVPTDFAFTSIGNNDMFTYIKSAQVILSGAVEGNVYGADFRQILDQDVFGAFAYLAFATHVLGTTAVDAAVPAIISAAAAIATCAAMFTRYQFGLPRIIALLAGGTVIFPTFSEYHFYCYFLSQTMFNLVLISAVFDCIERKGEPIHLAILILLFCYDVLYIYPALWFPSGATLAAIACLVAIIDRREKRKIVAARCAFAIGWSALSYLALALALHNRFSASVLRFTNMAFANSAGWPLGIMDPLGLVGFPIEWVENATWPDVQFGTVMLGIAVATIFATWIWRFGRVGVASTSLIVFAVSLALYVALWAHDGASYRQWKLAASYPAPFGFSVVAATLFVSSRILGRTSSAWLHGVVSVVLCFAFVRSSYLGIQFAEGRNVHFRQSVFRALSRFDDDDRVRQVIIDFPTYQERMFAIDFIQKKLILFRNPTYFGPGDPSLAGSEESPIVGADY